MKFWRLADFGNATLGTIAIAGAGAAKAVTGSVKPVNKIGAETTVFIRCTGSAPKVSIKVQVSFDGTNFVIPDDMASAILIITDTNRHVKSFSLTKAPFFRLQLDGDTDNGADTVVEELFVDYTSN